MEQVNNCLILNLDSRPDLWENTKLFREKWKKMEKNVYKISGVDYRNKTNVVNELIITNRINHLLSNTFGRTLTGDNTREGMARFWIAQLNLFI